jgi:cytochrome c
MRRTLLSAALVAVVVCANAARAQSAPPELFESKYCSGCHALDKKMVGPAIKEIAAKYKSRSDALTYISGKIKTGGSGAWGQVPMPPNDALTAGELKTLAEWILKQ